ncbi:hypothetical protein K7432_009540 [Basidiobolus ranarum]|uniref:Uncharacterized protein n=1 Tax=Basidiobolus ranarum TaxID=34480 RepID=A0ABR2WQ13_9FUNG
MHFKHLTPLRITRKLPRVAILSVIILLFLFTLYSLVFGNISTLWRDFGYVARPLWDTPPPSFQVNSVYRSVEGMSDQQWCALHGWTANEDNSAYNNTRVVDAVIFSIELDLLEIRIHELWDQVDMFIIAESDRTFTGKPKELTFQKNRDRFKFAESKIRYIFHAGRDLKPNESPFEQESELRQSITDYLEEEKVAAGDLIIMSDVDEIPRRDTIQLLRTCHGWGDIIHLEMREFVYSFEYYSSMDSWRASVQSYKPGSTQYTHDRQTDKILADAGWHCTFCFPKIEDFQFKMLAYSHADRVTNMHLMDKEVIRQKICSGENVFNLLPEVFTFKDLLLRWGSMDATSSFIDVPRHLLLNANRLKYLLPGGCARLE